MQKVPFYLLWFLIFSIPWQNIVTIPGIGTISRMIGFVSVGLAIIYIVLKRRVKEPSLFFILMIIFVTWSFITIFWSINPGATISRTVTNLQLLAMVWLMWELCDTREEILAIMQAYILGAYVSIINMLITFFTTPSEGVRITATGFNQNDIATTLALGIPIAWYLFIQRQKGYLAWINMFYVLFALFGIVLTASRGGLLVASVSLLIIPLTIFDLHQRSRYVITAFFVVIFFSGIIYLPNLYPKLEANIERLQETSSEIRLGTMTNRKVIWSTGLKVYKEHPIVGVGAFNFVDAVHGSPVDPSLDVPTDYFMDDITPHNTYLSVLVETGLIGFSIFLAIFGVVIIPIFLLNFTEKKFCSVLLISLIVGLVPLGWETDKTTWYVLSLLHLQAALILQRFKLRIIIR